MADRTGARAIIRITALPDSGLRRALTGTVDASRKAQADITRSQERESAKQARTTDKLSRYSIAVQRNSAAMAQRARDAETKSAERSAAKQATAASRLADAEAKAAERSAAAQKRSTEALELWKIRIQRNSAQIQAREAERSARGQIRDAQKLRREDQAVRRVGVNRVLAGGALVAGAASAAYGRVQSYASTFGAKSNEELASNAISFQRRSILVSDMGGQSAKERAAMQRKVLATSARTGVDAGELLAGLEVAQDRFSDLKGFTTILDDLANISVATGASVDSVVGAMGVMRRQFGLTDDEMQQLGGSMVQAADLGNISFQDVADNFAGALGAMGRNANLKGISGATTALGISQALGASDVSASEASTLGVRLVSSLNDVKVQDALRKSFGVSVTEGGVRGGALRGIPAIMREFVKAGVMDPSKGALRQKIFTEERGQRGFEVLATQFRDRPELMESLLNLDPAVGKASITRRVAAMNAGTAGRAATMGARNFAEFMQGDGMQKFLDSAVGSADELQKLQAKYPAMTDALGVSTGALKAFGTMLVAQVLLGRRGIGGGALPGGGSTSIPAFATGKGSLAANIGTAAAALGVFATSFELTTLALKQSGLDASIERAGAWFYDLVHGETPRARKGLGAGKPRGIVTDEQASISFVDETSSSMRVVRGGKVREQEKPPAASLKIEIVGPGRVVKTKSNDGFSDVSVENGSMSAPL